MWESKSGREVDAVGHLRNFEKNVKDEIEKPSLKKETIIQVVHVEK